jgi:hypothetical protein
MSETQKQALEWAEREYPGDDPLACHEREIAARAFEAGASQSREQVRAWQSIADRDADRCVALVKALENARSVLWDEWHSHMTVERFNSDPMIREINAALSKAGE